MSRKPVVMVIGASGNIGVATLKALTSQHSDKFDVKAGVRNPDTADSLKDIKGLMVVKATMGDEKLSGVLKGVERFFIVTPGIETRVEITKATAIAAKEAEVKHVVVVSGETAGFTSLDMGRQFQEIESFIKELGVPVTFLRLPFFMENYFAAQGSIKSQSTISMPLDPTKPFTCVAVSDAGNVAAAILAEPKKHAGKTYSIISNRHTLNELCDELSAQLGKTISYVRMPYDEARQGFLTLGVGEWQADGLLDTYRLIDGGSHVTNQSDMSHYRHVTGKVSTSLHDWVAGVKMAFK